MRPDHVPSSPQLLRPVTRALLAWLAVLLAGAFWIHAPLQPAADPTHPPDPAKAAWFLTWIQELVSHGVGWIWAAVGVVVLTGALPWLRREPFAEARWFRRGERGLAIVSALVAAAIVALTLVAMLLRGPGWRLLGRS